MLTVKYPSLFFFFRRMRAVRVLVERISPSSLAKYPGRSGIGRTRSCVVELSTDMTISLPEFVVFRSAWVLHTLGPIAFYHILQPFQTENPLQRRPGWVSHSLTFATKVSSNAGSGHHAGKSRFGSCGSDLAVFHSYRTQNSPPAPAKFHGH